MTGCVCCCRPSIVPKSTVNCSRLRRTRAGVVVFAPRGREVGHACSKSRGVRASIVDSYESSSDFVKRMEQAWEISQQPRPISCSSCNSRGHVECKWCGGTGFFILGDNMLCQVPSRNTSCVICAGKGSTCCEDCKGTGYRAKWLGEASSSK
ncbi:uncharacterized protein LOC116186950 [Punica granatum]|uniref:Protein EMBRYO SAC DEVELOPMENT ARREST 3, chloroplastic n=2 Tax=Punica granatum TaxID=22663 RepID=A0A218XPH6_PUNGR|nr:uncharacterized protein LOC116186950 [Punica granatum]OWM86824.1 hypothetical protein CDL15_Pgr015860 [Punica granatum]PKI37153.1 hypothetical protein CRG98_042488 [Punica granatum]